MKKLTSTILTTIAALGILGGSSGSCLAQGPAGDYFAQGSAPANAVWDLTSIPDLNGDFNFEIEDEDGYTQLDISFPISLEQAGNGKLTASGTTGASLEYESDDYGWTTVHFAGAYKANGTVRSRAGVTRVKLSASVKGSGMLEGAQRALSASHSVSFELDNATMLVTGRNKSKASATGLGSISSGDTWGPDMVDATLGNGAWQLSMGVETTGKKITGTRDAVVTLQSGKQYTFNVKGSYNEKKQQSTIVLSGKDLAKGSNLRITMGAQNEILAIKGKIAGQFVDIID